MRKDRICGIYACLLIHSDLIMADSIVTLVTLFYGGCPSQLVGGAKKDNGNCRLSLGPGALLAVESPELFTPTKRGKKLSSIWLMQRKKLLL